MRFFAIATLAMTAAASPVADKSAQMEQLAARRFKPTIKNMPTKSIHCGGTDPRAEVFSVTQIERTAVHAFTHLFLGTQVGTSNNYPKRYAYKDVNVNFPEAACNRHHVIHEFPIIPTGFYDGRRITEDLPHRLAFRKKKGGKMILCGLMTHAAAPPVPGTVAPYTTCK